MASANGSAGISPVEDDRPLLVMNREARRMNEQHKQGKPTTGRRGCLFSFAAPVAAALIGWAVR